MKDDKFISRDVFVKSGQKGGSKTALRGKKYYSKIGKDGAEKRWGEKKQQTVRPLGTDTP